MTRNTLGTLALLGITTGIAGIKAQTASADIQHLDDVIITFSLCVGNDCVNGENFGFDTLRLKENNLRIHFDDTSVSGSFPRNDWRIVINDSGNGGDSYFRIEDSTAGRGVFQIDAGAPANALRVDSAGDVGIGASNPVVELHVKDGDSPTLRLEQDGSSGFTAQTFDLVSNEANFFIRDVTNGSQLPFRIKPGADSDSLFIAADNNVGVGTDNPSVPLHVRRTNGTAAISVEEASTTVAGRTMLTLSNNGPAFLRLENRDVGASARWVFAHDGTGNLGINRDGGSNEFFLTPAGDLTISGSLVTAGSCSVGCDRVFTDEYQILPINERAEMMWANGYLPNVGPTDENGPFNVTDKLGRMLNELEHAHIYIAQLNERLEMLEAQNK